MSICLGCGQRVLRHVGLYAYWPLEVSVTRPALVHIEAAIRAYPGASTELLSLANTIRAHLQHDSGLGAAEDLV